MVRSWSRANTLLHTSEPSLPSCLSQPAQTAVLRLGKGGPWVGCASEQRGTLSPYLLIRIREQLQSVQAQWTRLQERNEHRREQLLASLQLQVRGSPRAGGLPGAVPESPWLHWYSSDREPASTLTAPMRQASRLRCLP